MATVEDKQVEREFREKLRLEKAFKPEIRSLFARINKSFMARVAATGQAPAASRSQGEWEGLLKKHYGRVQAAFAGMVSKFNQKDFWGLLVKQEEEEEEEDNSVIFAFALLKWAEESAEESAHLITETSQRNFDSSIAQARQLLQDEGQPFSDRDLAITAGLLLRRKDKSRVDGIACFETQKAAESTKLTEAEIQAGLTPSIIEPVSFAIVVATKKWRTKGDNKVRVSPFNHVAANSQVVKISQPFIVSGERLRHPGDTSLGASLGNVIRCRCVAIFAL